MATEEKEIGMYQARITTTTTTTPPAPPMSSLFPPRAPKTHPKTCSRDTAFWHIRGADAVQTTPSTIPTPSPSIRPLPRFPRRCWPKSRSYVSRARRSLPSARRATSSLRRSLPKSIAARRSPRVRGNSALQGYGPGINHVCILVQVSPTPLLSPLAPLLLPTPP